MNATVQRIFVLTALVALAFVLHSPSPAASPEKKSVAGNAARLARQVDQSIRQELDAAGIKATDRTSDADFLRRVSLDMIGTLPSPEQVTLFALDPRTNKRSRVIDELLESKLWARNWARYWRDVVFLRATNQRARRAAPVFEDWMAQQLEQNHTWDEITKQVLTATGDIQDNGATGLIFAHEGDPAEIAAEVSRIFLGIQLQCANCHDHPTDSWKRDQFHQLAAFFPRVSVRRVQPLMDPQNSDRRPQQMMRGFEVISVNQERNRRQAPSEFFLRRLDRDNDGNLTRDEVRNVRGLANNYDRALQRGDTNKDGMLSIEEIRSVEPPQNNRPGRGSLEHYMPDLDDPGSEGTKMDPVFFATQARPKKGLDDLARREVLSNYVTSRRNPWFARAIVNRIWAELLGEGFYMPVDDMGPERTASFPEVMELLCEHFTGSGYDLKWLFRTIMNSEAYQRQLRVDDSTEDSSVFAAALPMRLRGEQLYESLTKVLNIDNAPGRQGRQQMGPGGRRGRGGLRRQFNELFGYDPSTPQDDIAGSIPQALFMMNSPVLEGRIRVSRSTPLGRILMENVDDRHALSELYLLVLSREPTENETEICMAHLSDTGDRRAAFEDLMWALVNSTEFLTKR